MNVDEFEDVKADIYAEPWKAPGLIEDLLYRAITELGVIATGGVLEVGRPGINPDGFAIDCASYSPMTRWADDLLRRMRDRARSGVPFGEPVDEPVYGDTAPTNPEEL